MKEYNNPRWVSTLNVYLNTDIIWETGCHITVLSTWKGAHSITRKRTTGDLRRNGVRSHCHTVTHHLNAIGVAYAIFVMFFNCSQ